MVFIEENIKKGECPFCYNNKDDLILQSHHIIFRSQNKHLEHCKLNQVYLCQEHHNGKYGVHSQTKEGKCLDRMLKLYFKNKIEFLFDKEYLSKSEISQVLQISDTALNKMLKEIKVYKEGYKREDVIQVCMAEGKEENNDIKENKRVKRKQIHKKMFSNSRSRKESNWIL